MNAGRLGQDRLQIDNWLPVFFANILLACSLTFSREIWTVLMWRKKLLRHKCSGKRLYFFRKNFRWSSVTSGTFGIGRPSFFREEQLRLLAKTLAASSYVYLELSSQIPGWRRADSLSAEWRSQFFPAVSTCLRVALVTASSVWSFGTRQSVTASRKGRHF